MVAEVKPYHLAEEYHDRTACGVPLRRQVLRDRCVADMDRVTCRRCLAGWSAFVEGENPWRRKDYPGRFLFGLVGGETLAVVYGPRGRPTQLRLYATGSAARKARVDDHPLDVLGRWDRWPGRPTLEAAIRSIVAGRLFAYGPPWKLPQKKSRKVDQPLDPSAP